MHDLRPGGRIQLIFADAPSEMLTATVCSTQSDADEGLGPEVQDYVACWIEVSLGSCDDPRSRRSIALGTDFQYSMDGRKLTFTRLTP